MGPSDIGAIRMEIMEEWKNIPGTFGSFKKARLLQDEASKTFMERSGFPHVESAHNYQFMQDHKTQLESLACVRVLAALAGEAHRLWEQIGSDPNSEYLALYRSITTEIQGGGSRKEQK